MRKRRYLFLGLAGLLIVSMFAGCGTKEMEGNTGSSTNQNETNQTVSAGTFKTPDMEALEFDEDFNIADCYITNKITGLNHYYVDENKALWGNGRNDYGQLALNRPEDTGNLELYYEEYVKIAEEVVHVDCSNNGYFMVYLTENGELYGVGENLKGVLLEEPLEFDPEYTFLNPGKSVVYVPKLLMDNVKYARVGKDSITVLKENGEVYWWGEFCSTSLSSTDVGIMYSTEPVLMVENAKYATTGNWTAAAITEDNELYTWGWNTWGNCGVNTDEDYIYEAQKVLDGVAMVWPEHMLYDSTEDMLQGADKVYAYDYENLFVRMLNGDFMACGKGIGDEEKTIHMSGDLIQDETAVYSAEFLPITIIEK